MKRQIIYIITLLAVLSSCDYIESIHKNGNMVSEDIALEPFESIVIEAPYDIVLAQGQNTFIHLEGLDYLADGVMIEQNNSTLYLKHQSPDAIQKDKMVKMYINTPLVNSITVNAPGKLSNSDTLNLDRLTLTVNGRGTYFESKLQIKTQSLSLYVYGEINTGTHEFIGKTSSALFWLEGCSYVFADQLNSESVNFIDKSAGDCKVEANTDLNATIFSGGNIYYKGNPTINFTRGQSALLKSTGKVLPLVN